MKPVVWIASSRKDLRQFPAPVQREMGRALLWAQLGGAPRNTKVLRGFGGAGVLEIVEDHHGSTYRAVYTVKLAGVVYVLHAFQKKSKYGIETPLHDVELVRQRLAEAVRIHRDQVG